MSVEEDKEMRLERAVVHVDGTASMSGGELVSMLDGCLLRRVEIADSMVDECEWMSISTVWYCRNECICVAATGPIHDIATTALASHARKCISCRLDTSMWWCRTGSCKDCRQSCCGLLFDFSMCLVSSGRVVGGQRNVPATERSTLCSSPRLSEDGKPT